MACECGRAEGKCIKGDLDHCPSYEDEDCARCGGDGVVFECFDGQCSDADVGCDACTVPCPECSLRGVGDDQSMDQLQAKYRIPGVLFWKT